MIDSYDFGEIVIDKRRYISDLIIFPGRVSSGWWRREGHSLCLEDLEEALRERPEVLVVGTGYSAMMKVPSEVKGILESTGIELIVQSTQDACKIYNKLLRSGRRVVAALHLTC